MKINPLLRWFVTDDYLEIFLPEFDNIIRIESDGIKSDWERIRKATDSSNLNLEEELFSILVELKVILQ